MSKHVTDERKRIIGFKVSNMNILQQYADIFAQQGIEYPNTKEERCKLLSKNSIVCLFEMSHSHSKYSTSI
jgi:hypothetical protein